MSPAYSTSSLFDKHAKDGKLQLSAGFFQRYFENDGNLDEVPILQVTLAKNITEGCTGYPACFRLRLSDGVFYYSACFLDESLKEQCSLDNLIINAEKGGDIIAVTRSYIDFGTLLGKKGENTGKPMMMIVEYELLARGHSILSAGVSHDGDKCSFANFSPTEPYFVPCKKSRVESPQECTSQQLRTEEFCESDVIPISSITPYVSRWRICGLCTSKDKLKKYKRSAGEEVTVLCFELTDRDGAALRITGFDEVAEKLFPKIEMNRTYYVAGGALKAANKRFNTTGHDYELTINANTEFVSRDGRHCVKRDLSLIDESNAIVQLTLWNDRAENFEEKSLGHVISIKGAMVKQWSGTFSLDIAPSSKIEIDPQIDGSVNLADWFANKRKSVDVKRISKPVYNGDNFVRDLCFIGTASALQLGNESSLPNGRYMTLKAMITSVKTDNALYQSCANTGCSKKLLDLGSDQYRCTKCDTTTNSFRWAYMVQVELTDLVGSVWVTIFSKVAAQLYNIEAQELGEMKDVDRVGYVKLLKSVCLKYFTWRVNARSNAFNGETRVRFSVLGCETVPYARYIEVLQRSLADLKAIGC